MIALAWHCVAVKAEHPNEKPPRFVQFIAATQNANVASSLLPFLRPQLHSYEMFETDLPGSASRWLDVKEHVVCSLPSEPCTLCANMFEPEHVHII